MGVDVCLITDGDADRMGIADPDGTFLNQLQVYALLAYYLLEIRGERGLLRISSDWLLRLRYNPFYDFLEARISTWVAESSEPGP